MKSISFVVLSNGVVNCSDNCRHQKQCSVHKFNSKQFVGVINKKESDLPKSDLFKPEAFFENGSIFCVTFSKSEINKENVNNKNLKIGFKDGKFNWEEK